MFPRAPQFLVRGRGLHDPEWQTFYVTQHGIRHTGMLGWGKILSSDDIWRVTSFLTNLDKLPPAIQQKLQQAAASDHEERGEEHEHEHQH